MMITSISSYTPVSYNSSTKQVMSAQNFGRKSDGTYCRRLEEKIKKLEKDNDNDKSFLVGKPTGTAGYQITQEKINTRNNKITEYKKLRNYERNIIEEYLDLDEELKYLYAVIKEKRSILEYAREGSGIFYDCTNELKQAEKRIENIKERQKHLLESKQ